MARSRLTENQIKDTDLLTEAELANWIPTDLVCSGTITLDGVALSIDDGSLFVGSSAVLTSTSSGSGYTGEINVVTSTVSGEYTPQNGGQLDFCFEEYVYVQSTMTFENGLLTTFSGS